MSGVFKFSRIGYIKMMRLELRLEHVNNMRTVLCFADDRYVYNSTSGSGSALCCRCLFLVLCRSFRRHRVQSAAWRRGSVFLVFRGWVLVLGVKV